jgi:hypothetical protein
VAKGMKVAVEVRVCVFGQIGFERAAVYRSAVLSEKLTGG